MQAFHWTELAAESNHLEAMGMWCVCVGVCVCGCACIFYNMMTMSDSFSGSTVCTQ